MQKGGVGATKQQQKKKKREGTCRYTVLEGIQNESKEGMRTAGQKVTMGGL